MTSGQCICICSSNSEKEKRSIEGSQKAIKTAQSKFSWRFLIVETAFNRRVSRRFQKKFSV